MVYVYEYDRHILKTIKDQAEFKQFGKGITHLLEITSGQGGVNGTQEIMITIKRFTKPCS